MHSGFLCTLLSGLHLCREKTSTFSPYPVNSKKLLENIKMMTIVIYHQILFALLYKNTIKAHSTDEWSIADFSVPLWLNWSLEGKEERHLPKYGLWSEVEKNLSGPHDTGPQDFPFWPNVSQWWNDQSPVTDIYCVLWRWSYSFSAFECDCESLER